MFVNSVTLILQQFQTRGNFWLHYPFFTFTHRMIRVLSGNKGVTGLRYHIYSDFELVNFEQGFDW